MKTLVVPPPPELLYVRLLLRFPSAKRLPSMDDFLIHQLLGVETKPENRGKCCKLPITSKYFHSIASSTSSLPMDQEEESSTSPAARRPGGEEMRITNSSGDGSLSEALMIPRSQYRQQVSTPIISPMQTFYSRSSTGTTFPSSLVSAPISSTASFTNNNHADSIRPPRPFQFRVEHLGDASLCIYRLKLPDSLCDNLDRIKQMADEYASTLPRGWATTELYSLTGQDLAVRDVPTLAVLVQPIWGYILDAIRYLFQGEEQRVLLWDRYQPHILKYSIETGHKGVQLHHDHCSVTANLALSTSEDYVGGGTLFPDVGPDPIRLERGEFLLHPGSMLHGGKDIQQGSRYLMVMFVHIVP